MQKEPPFAIVVGAGLGGMAAALGLRLKGYRVQVWDRNSSPGGKIQELHEKGYRWDLGPSLMTMPEVIQSWFEMAGRRIEDYLELVPLRNTCRYFWQDGVKIDEDQAFWQKPEVQAILEHGEGVYRLSGKAYLEYPPVEFWRAFRWKNLKELKHLPKLMTTKTLAELVDEKVLDPHLRQLFCRYATYNGSSPYKTPATFSIIPYVESHFGGWYVRGGMKKVANAFKKIAQEHGVEFHMSQEVLHYDAGVLESKQGMRQSPDIVVCNGEVIHSANTWLKSSISEAKRKGLNSHPLSCSGFILLLGVKGENRELQHHNVSFSKNYQKEFESIYDRQEFPRDPTIYIAITQREDPGDAPVGGENWFVLVNAPAKTSFSQEEIDDYASHILASLRERQLLLPSQEIVFQKVMSSRDLAARDMSTEGALYGWASHSISSSLFRPAMKLQGKPIYFVGGSTHPGGGIPLVLLSAKMICKKILRDFS